MAVTGRGAGGSMKGGNCVDSRMPTGIAPPSRFKPPTASTADRSADRSPRDGYAGTITFGEIAAGTGSFIRYAKALGMQCKWFSEMDSDLHPLASIHSKKKIRNLTSVMGVN